MAQQNLLHFVFYFAAPPDKVWQGFVSLKPTASSLGAPSSKPTSSRRPMNWVGPGADGKPATYVRGEVLQSEPPRFLQYTFAIGASTKFSRVTIELVPETEATKVSVTHDQWEDDDAAYTSSQMAGPASSPASDTARNRQNLQATLT